ncbi:hypothetical protein PGT21_013038 [Puccinia graminis f. sp. tritici]|uniref:Uncharacterized protein n=1 Tax=Puccinia graminis f. sp. tritici TaxID=56615 RepID=A0A5B0PMT0_PUCGR|nr:hypothetical protein PGT21_013038 [Puccinia graminis f. sp. tritici]
MVHIALQSSVYSAALLQPYPEDSPAPSSSNGPEVLVVLLMCASYASSGRIPNGDIRELSKSTEPKPGSLAPHDDEDSCPCIIDNERQEQCGDTELCSGGCGKCASHCTCSDGAADSTRSSSGSNGSSKSSNGDSNDQEESSSTAESSPPSSLHASDSE